VREVAAAVIGGAWARMWPGLRTFSPSSFSSLPGWMMPPWNDADLGYPPRDHVAAYLTAYERRYDLAVQRPHRVQAVTRPDEDPRSPLLVDAGALTVAAKTVVSATGTWDRPFWPRYPGMGAFGGRQLHAGTYRTPDELDGQRVVVIGGGNSAAQILAEVSLVADTTWVASRPPRFLPDDVDGRALFAAARARIRALEEGHDHAGVAGLGDIVMVAGVKDARAPRCSPSRGCTWWATGTGRRRHAGEDVTRPAFCRSWRQVGIMEVRMALGPTPRPTSDLQHVQELPWVTAASTVSPGPSDPSCAPSPPPPSWCSSSSQECCS
jgi:cation diffusion facilitator CzcD-associated flavoprotein CzcO